MKLDLETQTRLRNYLLGQCDEAECEAIETMVFTDDDLFEELQVLEDEIIDGYLNEKLSPEARAHFEEHFLDNIVSHNELVEGAEDVLEYLKAKNYTLHIISNGFQEVTERKCTLSGIAPYFKTITSADAVGVRKPNPRIFEYSLGLSEAKKEESILIGDDWIADAMGATDFGMEAIFFDVYKEDKQREGLKAITHLQQIKEYL